LSVSKVNVHKGYMMTDTFEHWILCGLHAVTEETKYIVNARRLQQISLPQEGSQRKAVEINPMEGGNYNTFFPAAYCCILFHPLLACGNPLKAFYVSEVFHMIVASNICM
jgi:hypothetical protein